MQLFPNGHPMANAPRDVQVAVLVAETVGLDAAQAVLAIRLQKRELEGDREARALLEVANELGAAPQSLRMTREFGWVVETFKQAADTLIRIALNRDALTDTVVGRLYGPGLISKPSHDELRSMLAQRKAG